MLREHFGKCGEGDTLGDHNEAFSGRGTSRTTQGSPTKQRWSLVLRDFQASHAVYRLGRLVPNSILPLYIVGTLFRPTEFSRNAITGKPERTGFDNQLDLEQESPIIQWYLDPHQDASVPDHT